MTYLHFELSGLKLCTILKKWPEFLKEIKKKTIKENFESKAPGND